MVTKNKMPEKETEASSAFDCLAVTNVQVYPFQEGPSMGHTKGIASIVLNDQFMIRGLRVMDGENGLFVNYPIDPFFKGEEFRSLTDEEAEKYMQKYAEPEDISDQEVADDTGFTIISF